MYDPAASGSPRATLIGSVCCATEAVKLATTSRLSLYCSCNHENKTIILRYSKKLGIMATNQRRASQPYRKYPSIPVDPRSDIRVLKLLPGTLQEPVYCQLVVRRGSDEDNTRCDEISYEALSYTWGSWEDYAHVRMSEGDRLPVTTNLMAALRRLRREDEARILWIDQICINQDDVHERNLQVSRMDEVYRRASDVLVWMGDIPWSPVPDPQTNEHLLDSFFAAIEATQPFWWTRAWVIQEFALASSLPSICWGPHQVAFQELKEMLSEAWQQGWNEAKSFKEVEEIPWGNPIWRRKEYSRLVTTTLTRLSELHHDLEQRPRTLLDLALSSAQTTCSVASDKVFSLRALLSKSQRDMIEVDYTKSTATMYMEATYSEFVTSRCLDFLCCVAETQSKTELRLPSWAVDFTFSMREYASFVYTAEFNRLSKSLFGWAPEHHLLPEQEDNSNTQVQIDHHMGTLTLTGVSVDRVRKSFPLVDHPDMLARSRDNMNEFLAAGSGLMQSLVLATSHSPRFSTLPEEQFWNPWIQSQFAAVKLAMTRMRPSQLLSNKLSSRSWNMFVADVAEPLMAAIGTFTDEAGNLDDRTALRVMEAWSRGPGRQSDGESRPISMRRSGNEDFLAYIKYATGGHDGVLYVTDCGFIGLGWGGIQPGDGIIVPYCSMYPVVLRLDRQEGKHWTFLGLTLVEGIATYKMKEILKSGHATSYTLK